MNSTSNSASPDRAAPDPTRSGRSAGMDLSLAAVILAAGFGKRMGSRHPKVLFPLLGRPLLDYPLRLLEELNCTPIVIVVGNGSDQIQEVFKQRQVTWALQDPPRGTGDALRRAPRPRSRAPCR